MSESYIYNSRDITDKGIRDEGLKELESTPYGPDGEHFRMDLWGGQLFIHNILRRNISNAVSHMAIIDPKDKSFGPFLHFLSMYLSLLHEHHDTEEKIWFPKVKENAGVNVEQFLSDHTEMLPRLNFMIEIVKGARKNSNQVTDTEWKELKDGVRYLRDFIAPHLVAEESAINHKLIADHFTKQQEDAIIKEIEHHNQQSTKEPAYQVPFLMYSLTGEEQAEWQSRMPWILKKVLFPLWNWRSKDLFQFYFNPPK